MGRVGAYVGVPLEGDPLVEVQMVPWVEGRARASAAGAEVHLGTSRRSRSSPTEKKNEHERFTRATTLMPIRI